MARRWNTAAESSSRSWIYQRRPVVRRKVGLGLWVRGWVGWTVRRECERLDQSEVEFKYSWQNSTHLLFVGWLKKGRGAGSTCCDCDRSESQRKPLSFICYGLCTCLRVWGAANIWPHITASFKKWELYLKWLFQLDFPTYSLCLVECDFLPSSKLPSKAWLAPVFEVWSPVFHENDSSQNMWEPDKFGAEFAVCLCVYYELLASERFTAPSSAAWLSQRKQSLRSLLEGDFPTCTAPLKFKENRTIWEPFLNDASSIKHAAAFTDKNFSAVKWFSLHENLLCLTFRWTKINHLRICERTTYWHENGHIFKCYFRPLTSGRSCRVHF